ncbi:MAG: hypothetical protein ACKVVP_05385 [Chloroflexota bacterium]
MQATLHAALTYFGAVFSIGFVFGVLRTLFLAPLLGGTVAVLVELPLMLTISWFTCRWVIRQFAVAEDAAYRLAMGWGAFALVMIAELGVSLFGFGRTSAEHFESYRTASALLGVLAQIAFALFPTLQLRRGLT